MSDQESGAVCGATGWGDPPRLPRGHLKKWLAEVKARPGVWAWRQYGSPTSARATGTLLRKAGFETTTSVDRLYVRWPAEPQQSSAS